MMLRTATTSTHTANNDNNDIIASDPFRLLDLPTEIWLDVVSCVDKETASSLTVTCTKLTKPAQKVLWRDISPRISEADLKQARDMLPDWFDSRLIGRQITKLWEDFDDALQKQPVHAEYIQTLKYSIDTDSKGIATGILRRLNGVQEITDETLHTTDGPTLKVLTECGQLNSLKKLDLGWIEGTPDKLFRVRENFSNLVQLRTYLAAPDNSPATSQVCPKMLHLASLTFNGGDWPKATADLVARAPQLHHLDLRNSAPNFTNRPAALDVVSWSETIRTMDLGEISWDFITDEGRLGTDCLPALDEVTRSRRVSAPLWNNC